MKKLWTRSKFDTHLFLRSALSAFICREAGDLLRPTGLLVDRNGDFARLAGDLRVREEDLLRCVAGDRRRTGDLFRRIGDLERRAGERVDRFGDFAVRRTGDVEVRERAELENLSVRGRELPRRNSGDTERRSLRRVFDNDLREDRTGTGEVGADGEYIVSRFLLTESFDEDLSPSESFTYSSL